MTLPSLISFSGYATVGKDAAADLLVSRASFVKTYMSKPLEQALDTRRSAAASLPTVA